MKRCKPHSKLHVLALVIVGLGATVALGAPAPAKPAAPAAVPPASLKGAGVGQEQQQSGRRLREATPRKDK